MSCPVELKTVRDFLRYAISRFSAAKIVHGHGVTSAYDEAAFIVLEGLNLPIDQLDPFLDAALLGPEREKLFDLIEKRVTTRKPACYLLNKSYIQGVPFYVDERVIVPRSFIGELLMNGLFEGEKLPWDLDTDEVASVLDLCTGSGCLAILAAHVFASAEIHATELSKDALEVAKINLAEHDLTGRITLHQGDLFAALGKRKFDLIIANPPYVTEAEVAAFPPEFASEPKMAHVAGDDGLDIIRKILKTAPKFLNEGGGLLCEVGLAREALEEEFDDLPFLWLDTEESEGEVFWLDAGEF